MSIDNLWKGVTLVTSVFLVPLFIWIWSTNTKIETLRIDYDHTVNDVTETKLTVHKIEEEQNDMEVEVALIQQKLDRVEQNTQEVLQIMKGNSD